MTYDNQLFGAKIIVIFQFTNFLCKKKGFLRDFQREGIKKTNICKIIHIFLVILQTITNEGRKGQRLPSR